MRDEREGAAGKATKPRLIRNDPRKRRTAPIEAHRTRLKQ